MRRTTTTKYLRMPAIIMLLLVVSLMDLHETTEVAAATTLPPGFQETLVVSGLDRPTAMTFSPNFSVDGRLFVTELAGKVRIVRDGALLPTPFLSIQAGINPGGGLFSIEFDPEFGSNGYFYVYYLRPDANFNRISRFKVSASNADIADASSELVILEIPGGVDHNGSAMHFGPDGYLYVSTGDANCPVRAQSLGEINGKILRIDPSAVPNIVPPDNPFVGVANARGEIWAYGLRNPFKFTFNPVSGIMHINDVGQDTWEEVNLGARGTNYGWPDCEGICLNPAFEDPIYTYHHDSGCAITGGTFYESSQFPAEYVGGYFFTDYCFAWIKILKPDGTVADFATGLAAGPTDLAVGPDGSIYYTSYGNVFSGTPTIPAIYKISFVGSGNHNPDAAVTANPPTGLAPLPVDFSAASSTDPDNDALIYTWDFGDGSPSEQGITVSHTYQTNGLYYA